MRRAIKEKINGIIDETYTSDTVTQSSRPMTSRIIGFVKEKGNSLVASVQEHATSVADTASTLAKQKLLQTLFATGVVKSEHIRQALQIGIGYFLEKPIQNYNTSTINIEREKFPGIGGITSPHQLPDFDIEAFGIELFNDLMFIFGINRETLKAHICQGELKEIINPSSSGSLLYLTSDSKYLVKTLRDYDTKFIQQKFLLGYFQYIRMNPQSFLAKLLGVYGYIPYISQQRNITVDAFSLRFAIFANIVPTNIDIHEKYDLKGSSYKRDADFRERIKSSSTFKDNDFRDLHPHGLKIPSNIYYNLKEILTRDVEFLEKLNIMDYSLLLIVHNMDNNVKPKRKGSLEALMGSVYDRFLVTMDEQRLGNQNTQTKSLLKLKRPNETLGFIYEEIPMFDIEYAKEYGGIPAMNEKGERLLLFFGIIDILQTFDICKVLQRQYQTMENRDVVDERSIVEADFYAKRFKEFIFERVFRPIDYDNKSYTIPHTSISSQNDQIHDFNNHSYQSFIYPSLR